VKDQHTRIKGYRDLSQQEIDLMNMCKELAEEVGLLCDAIGAEPTTDTRWLNEGTLDLQKGFMSLIRSVAKPTTF
jgi:hypothetical protein